jgi:hypothetical protein
MNVYSSDGELLGTIAETTADTFRINTLLARDLWMRKECIVLSSQISAMLIVPSDEVDRFSSRESGSLGDDDIPPATGQANSTLASPTKLEEGLAVLSDDGEVIGKVKAIGVDRFSVDIGISTDLEVRNHIVDHILGDVVVVRVPSGQFQKAKWVL